MTGYIIEPQRDQLKGISHFDHEYHKCSPAEAEIWAVYEDSGFGLRWRRDFKTRGLAEQYLKQLGV